MPPQRQGWGRKKPKGHNYGANYAEEFMDVIRACYAKGERDANSKMSPEQVSEQLHRDHPDRFCIPSAWAVQRVFISLGQNKKTVASQSAAGGGQGGPGDGRRRRRGRKSVLADDVLAAVGVVVESNPDIKPRAALDKIKEQFPTLDEALHRSVKQRVTTLKSKTKTAARKAEDAL